ncbi:hypothetical protein VYU27_006208 [Nannochloropsis oceanica]
MPITTTSRGTDNGWTWGFYTLLALVMLVSLTFEQCIAFVPPTPPPPASSSSSSNKGGESSTAGRASTASGISSASYQGDNARSANPLEALRMALHTSYAIPHHAGQSMSTAAAVAATRTGGRLGVFTRREGRREEKASTGCHHQQQQHQRYNDDDHNRDGEMASSFVSSPSSPSSSSPSFSSSTSSFSSLLLATLSRPPPSSSATAVGGRAAAGTSQASEIAMASMTIAPPTPSSSSSSAAAASAAVAVEPKASRRRNRQKQRKQQHQDHHHQHQQHASSFHPSHWHPSRVTDISSVSVDGAVKKIRIQSLPGCPSLLPSLFCPSISSRQPGQFIALRIPLPLAKEGGMEGEKEGGKFLTVLAPIASAPERVGPRGHVDVLLDGKEELLPPPSVRSSVAGAAAATDRLAWSRLLSSFSPDTLLEASEELGPGFSPLVLPPGPALPLSLLPSLPLTLPSLLQEQRELLILARGTAGMAAVAAVLDWPKVGLLSGKCSSNSSSSSSSGAGGKKGFKITVLIEVKNAVNEALRQQQREWRRSMPHVQLIPVLADSKGEVGKGGGLEAALFRYGKGGKKGGEGGKEGEGEVELASVLRVDPKSCAVLLAGMEGGREGEKEVRRLERLAASLVMVGVDPARILGQGMERWREGGREKTDGVGAGKKRRNRKKKAAASAEKVVKP